MPCPVLVVSDADEDATKVVAEFGKRIRYLILPKQAGQGAAVNAGFEFIETEFFAVQHDDDIAHSYKYEALLEAFVPHPEAGMASGLAGLIDQHGRVLGVQSVAYVNRRRKAGLAGLDLRRELAGFNPVCGAATLYRSSVFRVLGGYSEVLQHAEELDYRLRLLRAGYNNIFVDKVVAEYRIHPGNKSLEDGRTKAQACEVAKELRERASRCSSLL